MINSAYILSPKALDPILIVSHPRSGTHLVMDLMRRQFHSTRNWRWWGLPLDRLYLNLERLEASNRPFSDKLAREIVNRPKRALLKTHFEADFSQSWVPEESSSPNEAWLELVARAKVIYVLRHPMDVMASYHQFFAGIDPAISNMTFQDFMRSPHWSGKIDRLGWWGKHVSSWAARPETKILRYEDIVTSTDTILNHIGDWLQETPVYDKPLLPPKVTSITRTRMDRIFSLSPSSTAIVADRANFPAVNWQTVLSDADRHWVTERIGPLLNHFGYVLSEGKVLSREIK